MTSRLFWRHIGLLNFVENTKDMNSLEGNFFYYLFVLKLNIYLVGIKLTSFSSRYTGPIFRMYLEFLDKFQDWVSHTKTRKIFVWICPPTVGFRGTSPHFRSTSVLNFYLWGQLSTLLYSVPIENEETLHQHNFYASQTIRNSTGILEIVRQSKIRRVHTCVDSDGGYFEHL